MPEQARAPRQGNDLRTRAPGRSCAKKTETTVKTISEDAHAQTERKPYRGTLQATQTTSKPMPKDAPAQRRPNDLQTNARGRSCAKNTETTSNFAETKKALFSSNCQNWRIRPPMTFQPKTHVQRPYP